MSNKLNLPDRILQSARKNSTNNIDTDSSQNKFEAKLHKISVTLTGSLVQKLLLPSITTIYSQTNPLSPKPC